MLKDSLLRVLREYKAASASEPYAAHPLAIHIRSTAANDVRAALGDAMRGTKIQGSAGAGNWALVPWISVFDLTITDSASSGYYVVYLFHASEPVVHLSLNQGTTAVRTEFGQNTREVLRSRANTMRYRIPDYTDRFSVHEIELGSRQTLPRDYEAGHIIGLQYRSEAMPDEETLCADLQGLVAAYRALTFRGEVEPSVEVNDAGEDSFDLRPTTLVEIRRHQMHRRIERNSSASRIAKKVHGLKCQCCGFDFEATYGEIGAGFIEVHHLKPLSELNEGQAVRYDVAIDFAVLCANCHRMIHRQCDPSDLAGLRGCFKDSLI